jgi:hypothetical protein
MDTKTITIAGRTNLCRSSGAGTAGHDGNRTLEPSGDERAVMDWWNSLPESERTAWVGEGAKPQASPGYPAPLRRPWARPGEGSLTLRARSI